MKNEKPRHTLKEQVEAFEQDIIEQALIKTGGNIAAASRFLQVEKKNLYNKMDKYHTRENLKDRIHWRVRGEGGDE